MSQQVVLPLYALPKLQAQADDIVIVLLLSLLFTYNHWIGFFVEQNKIPEEYWHNIPQANSEHTASRQHKADERRIAHVFEQQKLDFVVFWGSQSGRAEILARQFAKSLQDRFGLRTLAADLDDFDHAYLAQLKENHLCAFFISTYGDGDPTDNTDGLWSYLHGENAEKTLSSLRYAIFGLGNSNYRQFNEVAIKIDGQLQKYGASRFGNLGTGDDAEGTTENDFIAWRQDIQSELQRIYGWKEQKKDYQSAFKVEEEPGLGSENVHKGEPNLNAQASRSSAYRGAEATVQKAAVKEAYKLWEDAERLCLHVDLDLGAKRELKYKTGDHLAAWVCNPDHEVDQLLESLGLSSRRQVPISISEVEGGGYGKVPFPSPITMDALFRNYLEICGKLSMDLLSSLAEFAPSKSSRQMLSHLVTDTEAFQSTVLASHLTLGGLLKQVHSESAWNIPISFLMERLKPMQPRNYSISSSAVVQPRVASITVVVTKSIADKKDPSHNCHGLATNYLWALARSITNGGSSDASPGLPSYALDGPSDALSGGKLFCNILQSTFKLSLKTSAPIIMVGAGTGVAPFRAFVQERLQRKQFGQEVGKTLLFMGFRNSATDFIYKDDWAQWQKDLGSETFSYSTAFSRDTAGKKVYVQNLIEQRGEEVMDLMEVTGCRFYICGSATMARSVVDSIVQIRCRHTGCSRDDALKWVKNLRKFNALLEDVWG